MPKVIHWLCTDGKTMCGRDPGKMKVTNDQPETVTCSKCRVGIKCGWRDGGPKEWAAEYGTMLLAFKELEPQSRVRVVKHED